MANFTEIARELADAFETRARDDGSEFTALADDHADWIDSNLTYACHTALDDRLPDDWVYASAAAIADALTRYSLDDAAAARDVLPEIADGLIDVYNSGRSDWLASHLGNAAICDEAAEDGLIASDTDLFTRIGIGQYVALERIGSALIDAIETEMESRN